MYKLDQQGNFIEFKGSTIICPITQESHKRFHRAIRKMLATISSSAISGAYSLLPLDSMHITILGLVAEKYDSTHPADLKGQSFAVMEDAIINRLRPFFTKERKMLRNIKFKYEGILLDPLAWVIQIKWSCSAEERNRINAWIEACCKKAKVPHPYGFPDQSFHTTVCYRWSSLGLEQAEWRIKTAELKSMLETHFEKLKEYGVQDKIYGN
eukprot:TRINITY_DN6287_c0_g1_i2.p1 TRINITY_DN6287_c0_g1~~TRINITY_DN6287_c0_g1_i2.p1  ORF type:complete len:211 (+),score=7.43 TRINITY_DN6287_c0_g1_i2:513-1145(+)